MQAELDSTEAGDLPLGSTVRVLERTELADGTKRASVAREGEERPLGWVSTVGKSDGADNLLAADSAAAQAAIAISQKLQLKMGSNGRNPFNLRDGAESGRNRTARGGGRVYLPLSSGGGSITARMKFHFFTFQLYRGDSTSSYMGT
jgi:hypothetical protein